jgi:integrase/recombinase XerD
MTASNAFSSPLAPLMARYVAIKRALGRRGTDLEYNLRYLDRFLALRAADDLTRDTFAAWNESMGSLAPNTRRQRLRIVYHFCLFRRRDDPMTFVPDPTQFPPLRPRPLPYIYSEADLAGLLAAVETLQPHDASPLHQEVARLGFILLYTTGLRRGEVVRLTLGDFDPTTRVLLIRQTKFYKSRLVPVSLDTGLAIERYLRARRAAGAPDHGEAPLLTHCHGARFTGYTGEGFCCLLRKVIRAAGIRTARGRSPRIHDLRFTFAVQALWRWYRAGVDVQARLPALAAYLGHASVVCTQYYLPFFDATAEAASERFHASCAAWLPCRPEGR